MNNEILNIFLSKAQKRSLPHLTILEGSSVDLGLCDHWMQNYLMKLTQLNEKQIYNHVDLLFIKPDEDKKNYITEDFQPLFKFINNKATQLPLKIIIIEQADKITTIIANKLLKVLEEPPIELAVFLLNSKNAELLPTLNSRAIKLRLKANESVSYNAELGNIMSTCMNFQDFEQKMKDTETRSLLRPVLIELCAKMTDFKSANVLLNTLKTVEEDIVFNNSKSAQKLKLYHLLREFYPLGH